MHTPLRRSGMARVLQGSHSFTCTPHIHLLTEWTIPAFAFAAEAGTHLPTPEGWKAELSLGGWLVTYRNKCPAPGTEPGHGHHTWWHWAKCTWLYTHWEVECDHYHQRMATAARSDAPWWHIQQHSSKDLQAKCRCCPLQSTWSTCSGASR